jgi:hypothetical protein
MKTIFVEDIESAKEIAKECDFVSFFVLAGVFGMIGFLVLAAMLVASRDLWGAAGMMVGAGVSSVPVRMFIRDVWSKVLTLEHKHTHPDED